MSGFATVKEGRLPQKYRRQFLNVNMYSEFPPTWVGTKARC